MFTSKSKDNLRLTRKTKLNTLKDGFYLILINSYFENQTTPIMIY